MALKRYIRNLMILLAAGMLMVSLTGLRFYVHTCLGCDTREVLLFADNLSCCHTESPCQENSQPDTDESCCMPMHGKDGDFYGVLLVSEVCCDTESHYLKADIELTLANERILSDCREVPASPEKALCFLSRSEKNEPVLWYAFTDPPPIKYGRSFVIYAHCLKLIV